MSESFQQQAAASLHSTFLIITFVSITLVCLSKDFKATPMSQWIVHATFMLA